MKPRPTLQCGHAFRYSRLTETNAYGTVKIWKTRHEISADERIFLQCIEWPGVSEYTELNYRVEVADVSCSCSRAVDVNSNTKTESETFGHHQHDCHSMNNCQSVVSASLCSLAVRRCNHEMTATSQMTAAESFHRHCGAMFRHA